MKKSLNKKYQITSYKFIFKKIKKKYYHSNDKNK